MILRPALLPALVLCAAGFAAPAFSADALPKGIEENCLETQLDQCTVQSYGQLGLIDGPVIAFQLQYGSSNEYGIGAGAILYSKTDTGWDLLAADFDGATYSAPQMSDGDGFAILHVPGMTAGTGSFNADLLFTADYETGEWMEIDIRSWEASISDLLPPDRDIWKGVDYDFGDWFWNDFTASTPLWRPDTDANCCATGGWATIHFDIVDRALVARSVDYQEDVRE